MSNSVYRRGQVWYRKVDSEDNTKSSIQKGNRPVIIMSDDRSNETNSFVSVIPLTTEKKPMIPINVKVTSPTGVKQVALCNQLYPINKLDLENYMYTLSVSTMINVERGMMIAYGLSEYLNNLEMFSSFNKLQSVIEDIVQKRVDEILKSRDNITVDTINSYVDNLIKGSNPTKESSGSRIPSCHTVPLSNPEPLPDKFDVGTDIMRNALKNMTVEKKSSPTVSKTAGRKTSRWTIDVCKQYIHDRDKLSPEEMIDKYNLKDSSSIAKYYSYCKKKLNKENIRYE